MPLANARSLLTLLRWLGPWTPATALPANTTRRTVVIDEHHAKGSPYVGWLFEPVGRPPRHTYLIAPGLHFRGPSEPRMERFCRILASAGFAVLAPFLPDFVTLKLTPRLIEDFESAFSWLMRWPKRPAGRPAVFSMSFGSLPALRLAADIRHASDISHVICFGGYGDFAGALEFCLTGTVDGARLGTRDPLNQPAAFLNLLPYMDGVPDDPSLARGWLRYLRSTWGRPEMKAEGAYQAVSDRIERDVAAPARGLFRIGTGREPGGIEHCRPALERMGTAAQFVDPRPHLDRIRCRVTLVHGRDDDVIPYTQAHDLAAAFPEGSDVRVLLTGLYDHSRPAGGDIASRLKLVASEGGAMIDILGAIGAGHRRAAGQSAERTEVEP